MRLFAFTLLDGCLWFTLCTPLDPSIVRRNVARCYTICEFCSSNIQPIVIYAISFHVCMHGIYVSTLHDAFDLRITKFNYKLGCSPLSIYAMSYQLDQVLQGATLLVTQCREIKPPLRRLAHFTCCRPASWIAFLLCCTDGERNVLLKGSLV